MQHTYTVPQVSTKYLVYYMLMQRLFINTEKSLASAPREMFSNFKKWVLEKFPTGIMEEDWELIISTNNANDSDDDDEEEEEVSIADYVDV